MRPRNLASRGSVAAVLWLLLALLTMQSASAAPVVEGDPDLLFVVQPGECSGCTQAELDTLEEGLTYLHVLSYAFNRSFFPELCVAKTSLSRDMAVLTYDLVLNGQITESRWYEQLRSLAAMSGNTHWTTLWESINTAREGGLPYKSLGRPWEVPRYYFAIQLSRIYWHTVAGIWDVDEWTRALGEMPQGYHPTIDAALRWTGRPRQIVDLHMATSRPQDLWRELEIAALTTLPDDLQFGNAPADAELLAADYNTFLANNMFKTMWNGCGVQTAYGFHAEALGEVTYIIVESTSGADGEGGDGDRDEDGEEEEGDDEDESHYNLPPGGTDPYAPPNPTPGIPGPWTPIPPPGGGPDNPFPACWAFSCGWGNNPGGNIFDDDPQGGRYSEPPLEQIPGYNIGPICELVARFGYPLPPACVPLPSGPSGGGDGAGSGSGGGDDGGTGTGGGGDGGGGGGDFGDYNPFDDDLPGFDDWDWYNQE